MGLRICLPLVGAAHVGLNCPGQVSCLVQRWPWLKFFINGLGCQPLDMTQWLTYCSKKTLAQNKCPNDFGDHYMLYTNACHEKLLLVGDLKLRSSMVGVLHPFLFTTSAPDWPYPQKLSPPPQLASSHVFTFADLWLILQSSVYLEWFPLSSTEFPPREVGLRLQPQSSWGKAIKEQFRAKNWAAGQGYALTKPPTLLNSPLQQQLLL